MTDDRVGQQALDRALDEQEDLLLVDQPIHEARSRRIVAVEALLRQRRQSGEIRETSAITEAAEQGPELFVLDSFTMLTAWSDAARWMKSAPGVRLNLNLSPREFEENDIVRRFKNLADRHSIDPTRISLEITETRYIERPEETVRVLEELRALGLHLWLDDFGTRHSSLTHLLHFNVDGIKLAGEFVTRITKDERHAAIVRTLLVLAHELGLKVIAEEVEQQEQLDFLLEHDCDYIQGFLFSRP
ncbi:MAG TPA: EAL domain-containing protein, partial [Thermoanaerobaculia bacterium]|nr:EAL domain-containing protein [Thermoanaerobaculia bacterium]